MEDNKTKKNSGVTSLFSQQQIYENDPQNMPVATPLK